MLSRDVINFCNLPLHAPQAFWNMQRQKDGMLAMMSNMRNSGESHPNNNAQLL